MFRITRISGASTTIIKIEGKLLAPWVDEFEMAVSSFSSFSSPMPMSLDLSGLTFVDAAGLDVLAAMIRRGLLVSSCSNFVAELLLTVKS
jgi:anti-anti-sigma regulatory factor